jgi:hypothetical protein
VEKPSKQSIQRPVRNWRTFLKEIELMLIWLCVQRNEHLLVVLNGAEWMHQREDVCFIGEIF